jgi:hypothetical protein
MSKQKKGLFELIINKVTAITGVTEEQILGKSRVGHIMEARHIVRCLCYKSGLRKTQIAVEFGCSHATVIASIKTMENRILTEPKFRQKIKSNYSEFLTVNIRKPVYIIGKVTGEPYHESYLKFALREKQLTELGYMPINPMKLVAPETPWHEAMRICIAVLVQSYAVSPIDGWQHSKGANIEMNIAKNLDFPIMP